jgi:hypothetical protein
MKCMKITFFVLCIMLIFLMPVGCKSNPKQNFDQSPYLASGQNPDVTLSIKENTVTSKMDEITLIYTNNSKTEYLYGGIDFLEVEIDGIWYPVPPKDNVAWSMVAYILPPNGVTESSFPIKELYGDLESGKYRVLKTLSKPDNTQEGKYIIAEFIIK